MIGENGAAPQHRMRKKRPQRGKNRESYFQEKDQYAHKEKG